MTLNRTNDYLFKWLFGNERRKSLLLDFVNAVLTDGAEENIITDIEYKDRELDPKKLNEKSSRLDILARTNEGNYINIEIQVDYQSDIDKRTLYYWSKLHSSQLQEGTGYEKIADTVSIIVLNFNFFERERYHSSYRIYEDKDKELLNTNMQMHFLELPKWKKLNKKVANRLERWLLYLSNSNPSELEKEAAKSPHIAEALAAENTFQLDNHEQYWYEMRERFIRDYISGINANYNRGLNVGKEQGIEIGAKQKQVEFAKKLLKRGRPIEEIMEDTGLTKDETQELHFTKGEE